MEHTAGAANLDLKIWEGSLEEERPRKLTKNKQIIPGAEGKTPVTCRGSSRCTGWAQRRRRHIPGPARGSGRLEARVHVAESPGMNWKDRQEPGNEGYYGCLHLAWILRAMGSH